MRVVLTILTTLLAALTAHAVPQGKGGGPSQASTLACFVCPPADKAGVLLGHSDTSTNPIFCSYPAFPGENPDDFYCTYDAVSIPFLCLCTSSNYEPEQTTGALVIDNDAGFCPGTAVGSCTRRRRNHDPLPRAPQPGASVARDAKSALMKRRAELGAKKRKA
jgi:hypothetical protein